MKTHFFHTHHRYTTCWLGTVDFNRVRYRGLKNQPANLERFKEIKVVLETKNQRPPQTQGHKIKRTIHFLTLYPLHTHPLIHPPLNLIHIYSSSPPMTKTLSDRAQKAADTRAKNAELAQREAEQLVSETKGKLNCLKTWRF